MSAACAIPATRISQRHRQQWPTCCPTFDLGIRLPKNTYQPLALRWRQWQKRLGKAHREARFNIEPSTRIDASSAIYRSERRTPLQKAMPRSQKIFPRRKLARRHGNQQQHAADAASIVNFRQSNVASGYILCIALDIHAVQPHAEGL